LEENTKKEWLNRVDKNGNSDIWVVVILFNYWKNAIDFLERKKEGLTQPDHQLR
jgi:hypothetical protein